MVSGITQGPDSVGIFPTVKNPVSGHALRHGAVAAMLRPLNFLDAVDQHLKLQIHNKKIPPQEGVGKPLRASTVEKQQVVNIKELAATRQHPSVESAAKAVDGREPVKQLTESGVWIPTSGWPEAILTHILNNLQKLSGYTWSEEEHAHFRVKLMEYDWSTANEELPDLLLNKALHDENHKSVSRNSTADRLMELFERVLSKTGGRDYVLTVKAWFERLHVQPDTDSKFKARTHALGCPFMATGYCKRADASNPTLCPAQLKVSTLKIYKSLLKNHENASEQLQLACEDMQIKRYMHELLAAQTAAGRGTKAGTLCQQADFSEINRVIREWRNQALRDGESPLRVFQLDSLRTYIIWVKSFGRRGINILHSEAAKVFVLRTNNRIPVLAIDLVQNKVLDCDPTALCLIDVDDPDGPLQALREMYENLVQFGVDVSPEVTRFVFTEWELHEGQYQPVARTKKNPYGTWTPSKFDKLLKKAAAEAGVTDADKISVKSFRILNVALGAAADIDQEEVNLRMGWKPGSCASENYARLARMLSKARPTVDDEHRKALQEALYVSFSELIRPTTRF